MAKEPESSFPIDLESGQYDLLCDSIALDDRIYEKIKRSRVQKNGRRLFVTLDELDLMLEAVAAETNATRGARRKAFDKLADRLEAEFARRAAAMAPSDPEIAQLARALEKQFAEGKVSNLEEARAALEVLVAEHNQRRQEAVFGLSTEQIYLLIEHGWRFGTRPIELNRELDLEDLRASRFLADARGLIAALEEEGGTAATVTGNLNRKFVWRMLDTLEWGGDYREDLLKYSAKIDEMDVWQLHIVRIVCSQAGLLRQYKKRIQPTRKGKGMLADAQAGELFALLFETFFQKFELSYLDRMPEAEGIQATFPFILYGLSRLEQGKPVEIKELALNLLLPPVRAEVAGLSKLDEMPVWLLSSRVLGPLERFGLIELHESEQAGFQTRIVEVSKTPLFERFLSFRIE